MKYKTIGAFKNVQNVPYCKADSDMSVGMGVILDRAAKKASLPASVDKAKAVTHIVTNINDKPELHNFSETVIVKKDEYVRADDLRSVNGLEIEFAAFEITGGTTGLVKDDLLVFAPTTGLLTKVNDAAGYTVCFKVIALTAYMDDGILAEIVIQ